MKVWRILLGSLIATGVAVPLVSQTPAPVLGSLEAPYLALQNSSQVQIAGGTYGAGMVAYGSVGTPLVISGSDLGGGGTVQFIPYKNGAVDTSVTPVQATVTMWTPQMLFLTVPSGALTGRVVVTVEGQASNGLPFIVTPGSYSGSCAAGPSTTQLQITTSSLHDGAVSQAYSAALNIEGGTPPYTWSLPGNPFSWLLLSNSSTTATANSITGTPSGAATQADVTVLVTDSSSPHKSDQAVLNLRIEAASPLVTAPGGVYNYSASYDGVGNVTGYTDTVMGAWGFAYDTLNRLATANATWPDGTRQYGCWSYDAFGNRQQQELSSASFQSGSGGANSCNAQTNATLATDLASYYTNNQIAGTNSRGVTASPIYDAAGNVTYDGANQYLYDAEGRVCAVLSETMPGITSMTGYLYDANGTRVAKGTISTMSCDPTTNGFQFTENYVLGPGGEELSMFDGVNNWQRTNVYAAGKLLATYDVAGLHFHLTDPLGTRRMQLSGNLTTLGQPENDIQSMPFGDQLNSFPDPNAAATADDATPLYFTGKERDTESGNDYFFARYYSSSMGRFLSPDWSAKAQPVPYAKLDDPQTLNLYGYLRNNPLGGVDADGHCGGGANDPPCQKLPDNPASHVSADTKAQIKDAVAATKKPSGDDKKGGFHEEAGISYTKDGKQVQAPAQPGPYHDPTTPGPATSDPYKTANPSLAKPGDVQADVDYHTHPNGSSTSISVNSDGQPVSTTSSFVQAPSAVDIQNASPAPTINLVVGTGNNTAYFYTGAGVTCTESLKDFYKPQ